MKSREAMVAVTLPVQPLESTKEKATPKRWQNLISDWTSRQGALLINLRVSTCSQTSAFSILLIVDAQLKILNLYL